jgi:hypothetical protein
MTRSRARLSTRLLLSVALVVIGRVLWSRTAADPIIVRSSLPYARFDCQGDALHSPEASSDPVLAGFNQKGGLSTALFVSLITSTLPCHFIRGIGRGVCVER